MKLAIRLGIWLAVSFALIACATWSYPSENDKVMFRVKAAENSGRVALEPMLPVRFGTVLTSGAPQKGQVLRCVPKYTNLGALPGDVAVNALQLTCTGGIVLIVESVTFDAR